jgi:hypothetical protein
MPGKANVIVHGITMSLLANIIHISRANVIKGSLTGITKCEETRIAYDIANGIVIGRADGKANTKGWQ